ncbi:MAG: dNTP triphosphohydrolase [Bacteroidota bacterium]|nr:dNTP triphosphohydrolase [Bacteroidota bacterium]
MDLNKIFSESRFGKQFDSRVDQQRTAYQKDYDRVIFSSAFRRLQNKTQVFPLPGSVFVHNRLTHSLEVSSVGRSLGAMLGQYIFESYQSDLNACAKEFYQFGLESVIASACLCHDIGNPAFGHSGEDAMSAFFQKNKSDLKPYFSEAEWDDFVRFEGNANAIRVLTHSQKGKIEGGLRLTNSTLSAIAKYPCESIGSDKKQIHRKKFGFFQSEKHGFQRIAADTEMVQDTANPLRYFRHPFVWLVEAADDICYNIIDFEDAHRLGIIEHQRCFDLLFSVVEHTGDNNLPLIRRKLEKTDDKNEKITYLRAIAINSLLNEVVAKYKLYFDEIMSGKLQNPLYDIIKNENRALQAIADFSVKYIYNHRSVLEIENAGYNVMYELLNHFVPPLLKPKDKRDGFDEKSLLLLPKNFNYDGETHYERVMGVMDYISGMTDNYATDLYRRIKGIDIGMRI